MSSSKQLVALMLLSACGRTVDSGTNGLPATGGSFSAVTGGSSSNAGHDHGGGISGSGTPSTGGTHATAGVGGRAGTDGKTGTAGSGVRVPAKHRATAIACGMRPAMPPGGMGGSAADPSPAMCSSDTDCKQGVNGHCILGRIGQYCTYDACFEDIDCAAGQVCMCAIPGGAGSRCSQSGCRVDADCEGSWCSPTFSTCGNYSGVVGWACHTPKDDCIDDSDCGGNGPTPAAYCMYSPELAHWVCSTSQCAG